MDMAHIVQVMRQLAPQFNTMFDKCHRSVMQNCSDMFVETVTDDGICYTYNAMSSHDIYRTEKYYAFDCILNFNISIFSDYWTTFPETW